jgi:hypothetical protein
LLFPAHCSLGCEVTQIAAVRRIDDLLAEQGMQTLCLGSKFDALKSKVNVNSIEESSLFIPKGKHTALLLQKRPDRYCSGK